MSDRHDRQRRIRGFDQQRLTEASVLVLGAGALGNEVVGHLAAAGVGELVIVDHDTIELSNLHRTRLFRSWDVGKAKATVAAQEARRIDPAVRAHPIEADLRFDLGFGWFRRASLVVGCLDSVEARASASRLSALAGRDYLDGGTSGLAGEVRLYRARSGACYECGLGPTGRARIATRWRCTDYAAPDLAPHARPALGASTGVVGSHLALMALLALQDRVPAWGVAHHYDGAGGVMAPVHLQRDPGCVNHAPPLDVHPLPTHRAATTTCADLGAARRLDAVALPHTFVASVRCSQHHVEPVGRVIGAVVDTPCPVCGGPREAETWSRITPEHPAWAWPLRRLGVPEGDIVGLAVGDGMEWVELSGDLPTWEG